MREQNRLSRAESLESSDRFDLPTRTSCRPYGQPECELNNEGAREDCEVLKWPIESCDFFKPVEIPDH